jgi:hypothetical protein
MIERMQDIFDLQRKLNAYTLKNIGLDYERAITDPEQIPVWVENYRKALSAELAELIREIEEFGPGTKNGKIEVVDMLHFLVSLSHIVQIEAGEAAKLAVTRNGATLETCAVRSFLALDELQNSVKWKWWAKGGGYKEDKAKHAVLELWRCFGEACGLQSMDFNMVKEIYIAKNRVNFERQDLHYNEDTKSEHDNQALKVPTGESR